MHNDFGFLEWAQTDTVFLDYTFSSSLPIYCNVLFIRLFSLLQDIDDDD